MKTIQISKSRRFLAAADIAALTNIPVLLCAKIGPMLLWILIMTALSIYYIFINIKPSKIRSPLRRLNFMYNGRELLVIFLWSFVFNITSAILWKTFFDPDLTETILFLVSFILTGIIVVFNGVMRLMTSSARLGIVQRVLIILFWWVPVVNIFIFQKAAKTAYNEFEIETEKYELDSVRKENEICKTKYPILMVHGVFFRDLKFFNYWGRVPKELIRNGAEIYYGNQQSAASVEKSAEELKNRITEIIEKTGCEKVNIIAHSKGGLDSRYAVSCLGMAKYVASLTTVNTPHCGCEYADFLLKRSPASFKKFISERYNSALKKLGDPNPDFLSAVHDLTTERAQILNEKMIPVGGVFCQSVGSRMKKSSSAPFPQNLTYRLVRHFNRIDNDGLVDTGSMKWGSRHVFFEPKSKRGISHGDMIDLAREDIPGFDIREEYVKIVSDLKSLGY